MKRKMRDESRMSQNSQWKHSSIYTNSEQKGACEIKREDTSLGAMQRKNYAKWNSYLWGSTDAQFWIYAVSKILNLNIVYLLYSIKDNNTLQCGLSRWSCVFSCVFFFLDTAIPLPFFSLSESRERLLLRN